MIISEIIKKRSIKFVLVSLVMMIEGTNINAQQFSTSSNLVAQKIPDRTVAFNVSDTGTALPIIWGLDLAWPSEENLRRGVAFMGIENVDIVRASFQPTYPLVDGDLQQDQIDWLNLRLDLIDKYTSSNTAVVLNSDHPSVDPWYFGYPLHWAQLIDATTKRVQERGRTVVTVSPFNEPDYSYTGQGDIDDFYQICEILDTIPRFDSIRIGGGNTLNCSEALGWYEYLNEARLDEGNTHQLAGEFNGFANFFQTVRENGDHASDDELHNVMECMVGAEYGMQTGIWWGTAEYARGEFVKASDGRRLGYAEHRPNWTAASVYLTPDGRVQAFGGVSERQASTTTYRYFSKDRPVFYDGVGPQYEYVLDMPGGSGYATDDQKNAERVINISWGEDVQPAINGTYILVNRKSGKVLEVADGATYAGANLQQGNYTGANAQQWKVTPVDSRIGGDFSYYTILGQQSGRSPDIYNWSLDDGRDIKIWDNTKGSNQQWYLEYIEDGWFYIGSRWSAKCMEVADAASENGANVQQYEKDGGENQQWRFVPVGTSAMEFESPSAPTGLIANPFAESVKLSWTASVESDAASYTIFRSDNESGPYFTIAREVASTEFIDNSATSGGPYYYVVKAVDHCLNRSVYSNEAEASPTDSNALVLDLLFDGNLQDSTINMNHGAVYGTVSYIGSVDTQAIVLNGTNTFVQLPANIANQEAITVATWVYWRGGASWQRIFDFGNGESQYMFLTTSSGSDNGKLRFAIKNDGDEEFIEASKLSYNEWAHVAVTLNGNEAKLYVNGELVSESAEFTIDPLDFKPVFNFIGRSQYSDPLFRGYIDDFRVYNYALSGEEVVELTEIPHAEKIEVPNYVTPEMNITQELKLWPVPVIDVLNVEYFSSLDETQSQLSIYDVNGKLLLSKELGFNNYLEVINVSNFSAGVYLLKITNSTESVIRKFIIKNK